MDYYRRNRLRWYKMTKTFLLEIKMGNAAMNTQYNIAAALENTIRTLKFISPDEFLEVHNMHDVNGNTVGKWRVLNE